jgi:hypothetical protein
MYSICKKSIGRKCVTFNWRFAYTAVVVPVVGVYRDQNEPENFIKYVYKTPVPVAASSKA